MWWSSPTSHITEESSGLNAAPGLGRYLGDEVPAAPARPKRRLAPTLLAANNRSGNAMLSALIAGRR
ncbi:hypothetical protein SMICM17S_11035 [Streptomyces microflavus]